MTNEFDLAELVASRGAAMTTSSTNYNFETQNPWGGCVMEFADSWAASPWPDHVYEPVLKLHLRNLAQSMPESADDDSGFVIQYDPTIVDGRYSRPKSAKQREDARHFNEIRPLASRRSEKDLEIELNTPVPYDSPQQKNIIGIPTQYDRFAATKTAIGPVLRIKAYGVLHPKDNQPEVFLESYAYTLKDLKNGNTPIISQYPRDFLLYTYRNYIKMPFVNRRSKSEIPFAGVKQIEMCLHAVVMTQVFKLRLQDFPEVEPNWHCLASTEVNS
jgi:hypothetical protein